MIQSAAQSGSRPRVGVVGAGPGGLASAVMLAASGCDVTILEARDQVGGRTGRIDLHDDDGRAYGFDLGPTFFLMPYVLGEIFAAAGERMEDHVELTRLDPMYRLLLGRPGAEPITLDATQNIAEMSRRLSEIEPADGDAFERFIFDNRAKLRAAEPILRRPIRSVLDLIAPDAIKAAPHINPHLSVHDLLGKYFSNPHVKLAVSFQSKYLGMSPYECPSLFTILPLIEYEYGVWHPRGGCHALMRAMAGVFEKLGGSIRLNTGVKRLAFKGNTVTGAVVETASGEETVELDHVVINADASWALQNLIPPSLRPRSISNESLQRKRYSCSTFMMYAGLDGAVDLPHHTIYVSGDYKRNLDDISIGGGLSPDPSMYICNPVVTDPTMAPEGASAIYALMPTPNLKLSRPDTSGGGIDWRTQHEGVRAEAIRQMERVFGIEDCEKRLRVERTINPEHWRDMNIANGATFNLAHNLGQMLHKRPQHEVPGVEGVWLVGGGTHPGSGLPVIFLSSQITTRLICEREGLDCSMDVPFAGAEPAQPAMA